MITSVSDAPIHIFYPPLCFELPWVSMFSCQLDRNLGIVHVSSPKHAFPTPSEVFVVEHYPPKKLGREGKKKERQGNEAAVENRYSLFLHWEVSKME
jgi:hypothetical protein